uniref:Uncharacterized protein n=1 Tax=Arundo donax TaxID=35708 RepID=A0A0A9GUS0_ARUDO
MDEALGSRSTGDLPQKSPMGPPLWFKSKG